MAGIIEKKLEHQIKAAKKTDTKADIDNVAIWAEKGIPIQSPNGKTWLITIDDSGNLVSQEVI